jgi:glycosyltransferase involved in cell wall biosynthesis
MTSSSAKLRHVASKISIIMPAFNESEHIIGNLREVVSTFQAFGCDYEVLVVDDGSPDNTHLHAARVLLERPERVRIVRYDRNQGKGNALIAGFLHCRGDYVVFLDADMDLHPSQLPIFFEIMEARNVDAVIGSKRHPESQVNYPFVRQLYSFGYYGMVRILFGLPLRDTQTGLKLFKRKVLEDVFPRVLAKRFAFDIEVLAIAHWLGYAISDAPVRLTFQRKMGRINMRHVWSIGLDTLAIFYRLRLRRYYDKPHCKLEPTESEYGRELTLTEVEPRP